MKNLLKINNAYLIWTSKKRPEVRLTVVTWSRVAAGGSPSPRSLQSWVKCCGLGNIPDETTRTLPHDIYAFGTQENPQGEREWVEHLRAVLRVATHIDFKLVSLSLFSSIFLNGLSVSLSSSLFLNGQSVSLSSSIFHNGQSDSLSSSIFLNGQSVSHFSLFHNGHSVSLSSLFLNGQSSHVGSILSNPLKIIHKMNLKWCKVFKISICVLQVAVQSLWSIRLAVFVRLEHEKRVSHVSVASVKTGLGNTLGTSSHSPERNTNNVILMNPHCWGRALTCVSMVTGHKGAVGVSFLFSGTSLGFVNCHLSSGSEKTVRYYTYCWYLLTQYLLFAQLHWNFYISNLLSFETCRHIQVTEKLGAQGQPFIQPQAFFQGVRILLKGPVAIYQTSALTQWPFDHRHRGLSHGATHRPWWSVFGIMWRERTLTGHWATTALTSEPPLSPF